MIKILVREPPWIYRIPSSELPCSEAIAPFSADDMNVGSRTMLTVYRKQQLQDYFYLDTVEKFYAVTGCD